MASLENHILFDCDTGVDDAIALLMIVSQLHKVKLVGITCVDGNTSLNNVVMNNLRLLKLCDQLGKIPIYKGCSTQLIPIRPFLQLNIHGSDGMGGKPDFIPESSPDLLKHVEVGHAVNEIIRLSKEYAGLLKIVATGPLTNLAMAVRLDPDLPSRLLGLYVMGGTRYGHGNLTPAAEFNFCVDPEAAYITLNSYSHKCPTHLINYEYTFDNPLPWNLYHELFSGVETKKKTFAKMFCQPYESFSKDVKGAERGMVFCDALAMAIALDESIGLKPRKIKVNVELGGHHSRGHVIVDHYNVSKKFSEVVVYDSFDFDKYHKLLKETLQ